MTAESVYTTTVRRQLRTLFANWPPGATIRLGDYGTLTGSLFQSLGNISEFDLTWTLAPVGPETRHSLTSSRSVSVKFKAAGKAGTAAAKARMEIGFQSGNGVYFDAAGCAHHAILDKRVLGEKLLDTLRFDRGWAVVTDLYIARRSIIAISSGAGGSLVLQANGRVPEIDLANASLGLKAVAQQNIGHLTDAKKGLTPLIGLSGFKRTMFRRGSFHPFQTKPAAAEGKKQAPEPDLTPDDFVRLP